MKRDLYPVLRKNERYDLTAMQKEVKGYLAAVMIATEEDKQFWAAFAKGEYRPALVFGEGEELSNVSEHPMALWKCRDR